jgi:hypothetical protein
VSTASAVGRANITDKAREHRFYGWMGAAMVLTVIAGFARTWFFKALSGAPALSPLIQVHAVVFTSWIILIRRPGSTCGQHPYPCA